MHAINPNDVKAVACKGSAATISVYVAKANTPGGPFMRVDATAEC